MTQIGNNISESEASIQSRTALNAGEMENSVTDQLGSRTAKGIQRYARLSGYKNKFETKMSVSRRSRIAQNVATKPIATYVLQYCSNRKIGILQAMYPHTPLQDDGDKPIDGIWRRVCRLGCVHTQTWYEHTVGFDMLHRDPRGTQEHKQETEDMPRNGSRQLPVMIVNIETECTNCVKPKERWTSLRHFSR